MKSEGKILSADTVSDKDLLASIMDNSDSDSDDVSSSHSN